MIYPQNFENKIGFYQITQLLKEKCLSHLGEGKVSNISFSDKYEEVNEWTDQTAEFVQILQ